MVPTATWECKTSYGGTYGYDELTENYLALTYQPLHSWPTTVVVKKKLLENHQPITACTQWFAQQRQWLLIDDLI